ncbi:MAG: hypothetical protein L3J16_02410 [Anaerolineales bacterium]|nr:hypothetical protein [Anaerolineales bacterium]
MINTKLGSNSTLSAIRRQTGAGSLLPFMKMYLRHRTTLPWSRMHEEIATDYKQIGSDNALHLVLAAPDGYGKTTVTTFALVLWALAYKHCRCIAIGSHTRTAAGELLRSVDHELRTNQMLRTDFPHLAALQRGSGSSGSRASPPRDIYVRGVARLTTFGPTSSLGEITFEGSPPDLIILDGFEANPEENENPNGGKSAKLKRHIHREILSRYTGASVIVLGTLTHANSLIDRLLKPNQSSMWTQRFYQAVDSYPANFDLWVDWAKHLRVDRTQAQHYFDTHREQLLDGVEVLWPKHEPFEQMMSAEEHERVFNWLYDLSKVAPFDIKATAAQMYRRVAIERKRAEQGNDAPVTFQGAGFQYEDGLNRPKKGVNDGNGFLFISHIGEIQPSGFLPLTAGLVREDNIVDVYRNHEIFKDLRDYSKLKGVCRNCEYRESCGGQRGRAYGVTGDYMESDPACILVAKAK